MKHLLLLILIAPLTALQAQHWLYKKDVIFDDHHDRAVIKLIDAQRLYLDDSVYYKDLYDEDAPPSKNLRYRDVVKWKQGRVLSIAYSLETGAVLLDPKTGLYTEIISGMKEHPLDALHKAKLGEGSFAEIVVACNESRLLWLQEIERIYARLKKEHPGDVEQISAAEEAWKQHYEAQIKAINITNNKDGSLYLPVGATQRMQLTRDFALNLVQWGRL